MTGRGMYTGSRKLASMTGRGCPIPGSAAAGPKGSESAPGLGLQGGSAGAPDQGWSTRIMKRGSTPPSPTYTTRLIRDGGSSPLGPGFRGANSRGGAPDPPSRGWLREGGSST